MKCTSCHSGELRPSFIDGLFRAHTCDNCEGNWILIEDYVAWKERNPDITFNSEANFDVDESTKALLCPVTGTIMRKFRLTASNSHKIDYSVPVGGVWLDKGEWQMLKAEGLAGNLNAVLTTQWQQAIRHESAKDNFTAIYQDKFGESYAKIKEMRSWLDAQPNRADIRAYLFAEDPYSAEK